MSDRSIVAMQGIAVSVFFTTLAAAAARIDASNLVLFTIPGAALISMFWITGPPGDRWRPFLPQRIAGVASLPGGMMLGAMFGQSFEWTLAIATALICAVTLVAGLTRPDRDQAHR